MCSACAAKGFSSLLCVSLLPSSLPLSAPLSELNYGGPSTSELIIPPRPQRDTYKVKPIDRALATKYADQHIEMYLPAPLPSPAATTSDTSAPSLSTLPAAVMSHLPPPLSSSTQATQSPPTPAPTPTPDVPLITVKLEEGAEPLQSPATATAPPSIATQVDAPTAMDVVQKVIAEDEGILPSPRSLEAREEEADESAERGGETRVNVKQSGQQE